MITGLNHLTLAVADLDRAFAFYVELLGCRAVARWARGAYLVAGDLWLCLSLDPRASAATRDDATHVAFSVEAESFADATRRLADAGVEQWRDDVSEGPSVYVRDPDGHRLELHVGDLATRLAACRAAPYEDMEFFD
jgi:catechol 2,3-dioxygenase-like lactoylglutathione lyase family enzyme